MKTVNYSKAVDNWKHLCCYFSVGECGQRCVLLWASILDSLQFFTVTTHYSAPCFLWGFAGSHHSVDFCLSFWTVNNPKSKCNLAQHDGAREPLNEIDSGVLKSQVWFHIALASAGIPSADVQDEKLINFYRDICRRGKFGSKGEKKFQLLHLPWPFFSSRTQLIFLLIS